MLINRPHRPHHTTEGTMTVTDDDVEKALQLLTATPHQIAALSQGLLPARLSSKPHSQAEEDAWSPNDILAHLRACADVWGKAIRAMIAEDHPTLRYISPRTWIKKTNYPAQDFHASLRTFTQERMALVAALQALPCADWSRRGATFTGTTRGREQTILTYVRRITDHESEHLAQLEALLKPQVGLRGVQPD